MSAAFDLRTGQVRTPDLLAQMLAEPLDHDLDRRRFEIVDVERDDLIAAFDLPGRLRANDAIHLATALRVGADTIVSYDVELDAAAATAGLVVVVSS